MLVRHGYGVLLYDRRGEGASEGDPDAWGWDFDKDIRAGLDFLPHRDDVDPQRIGGLGLSVGGEMMLQTAADTKELAAIVSEGAGARTLGEELDDVSGFDKVGTALSYSVRDLSTRSSRTGCRLRTSTSWSRRSPLDRSSSSTAARTTRATEIPTTTGRRSEPKQIWEAKGGHTDGIDEQPREYERRVIAFFDDALL